MIKCKFDFECLRICTCVLCARPAARELKIYYSRTQRVRGVLMFDGWSPALPRPAPPVLLLCHTLSLVITATQRLSRRLWGLSSVLHTDWPAMANMKAGQGDGSSNLM